MAFPTDFQAIVKLFHFTPNNVQGHFTVHRRVGSLDASLMRFVTSVNIAKLFLRVCEFSQIYLLYLLESEAYGDW